VEPSATQLALPTTPESDQSVGLTAHQVGLILVPNVKRSLTAEQLASQSIPALPDIINPVPFAIQIVRLVTMESDPSAGNPALLAGLILVLFAVSLSISMEKDAVVPFSVAVVTATPDTLMMVAPAEDLAKLWLRAATVMALDPQWVAQATKISMEDSAIQNAKLVTMESVQSAGNLAQRAILTLVSAALNQPKLMVLESQWSAKLASNKMLASAILHAVLTSLVLVQFAGVTALLIGHNAVLVVPKTHRSVLELSSI